MTRDKTAADISHRRETRLDGCARIGRGAQRLFRNVERQFFEPSLVEIGEVERHVRVRIHEAGRERRVTEIDHLRAVGRRQIGSNIDNLVALHDDDPVLDERVRLAVEQPGGFEHDRLIGRLRSNRENENCEGRIKRSHFAGVESQRALRKQKVGKACCPSGHRSAMSLPFLVTFLFPSLAFASIEPNETSKVFSGADYFGVVDLSRFFLFSRRSVRANASAFTGTQGIAVATIAEL